MAKFNKMRETTHEGAAAIDKNVEHEWVNALCSSFLENGYYEDKNKFIERYVRLTKEIIARRSPEFAAKAAVFSRNVLGMRSVSTLTAAILNKYNWDGKKAFYREFFRRPDDVSEVFSAVDMLGDRRSHALVKGACGYLSGLSAYSVGKYKLKGRDYNMFDIINITHAHSVAIDQYKNGSLPVPNTWETRISAAKTAAEKAAEWKALVDADMLGYMALLRNLGNLVECCHMFPQEWWKEVYNRLKDEGRIRKSMVFPYRFYVACKELDERFPNVLSPNMADRQRFAARDLLIASLGEAFLISVENNMGLKELEYGDSLFVLDVSGSMTSPASENSVVSLKEMGACYAVAMLVEHPCSRFVKFGSSAIEVDINKLTKGAGICSLNVFDVIDHLAQDSGLGYSTNINSVWGLEKGKPYDRIFIFSDLQVMDPDNGKCGSFFKKDEDIIEIGFDEYRRSCGTPKYSPCVYSFDLGQYSKEPVCFGGKVNYFTALSAEVLKLIDILESGRSICDYIDSEDWR